MIFPKCAFQATLLAGLLASAAHPAMAQVEGKVGEYSDATIQGSVVEPEKVLVPDDAELLKRIKAPEGFQVGIFARDLVNPRMLAVSPAGNLYATRRDVGDVILLKDTDGDGRAEKAQTVASRAGMHGIAFDGNQVFLVTVHDVYVADVAEDGTFSELRRIINDLPDAGQHPNRTIAVGPDGMLYISVGSTCNACLEPNPENATILRATKDGQSRTIFASGLRNTIGFDWEPTTGALYGLDHGIDWLGDEEQIEELNLVEKDKQYGWPFVYGMGEFNPQDNPPEGMTLEQWAKLSTEPSLGYTAHSAPMQSAFYNASQFPSAYVGDLFVAMRGSWNRRPPSGYEVVRINFEGGKPVAFEPFLEGFLITKEDGGLGYLARLAGIAVGKDGSLFVSDDSNGIIYRVSHKGAGAQKADASEVSAPNTVSEPPAMPIAIDRVDASLKAPVEVKATFADNAFIPVKHSADGDNASPKIEWSAAPAETKSFAILMDDPDAASPKPFTHWIVYDLPPSVTALREGFPVDPIVQEPKDVKQGKNSMGATGYFGPKPPVGDPAHHYHFQVFALDIPSLGLDPGALRDQVLAAMEGHVLAEGQLVGQFKRPPQE